jgi:hypothetical protein
LNHHDDGQSDQRHQIAADRGDQETDHLADRGSPGGQPRDEFRRVPIGEKSNVLLQ